MSPPNTLSPASQSLCRTLWQDGYGARRMAMALARRGMESGNTESLIKRVLRWRAAEGLPARWQAAGRPPHGRASTRVVPIAEVNARIDAAMARQAEQERAELACVRRRCDCGGIIAPNVAHQCRRWA